MPHRSRRCSCGCIASGAVPGHLIAVECAVFASAHDQNHQAAPQQMQAASGPLAAGCDAPRVSLGRDWVVPGSCILLHDLRDAAVASRVGTAQRNASGRALLLTAPGQTCSRADWQHACLLEITTAKQSRVPLSKQALPNCVARACGCARGHYHLEACTFSSTAS